MFTLSNGLLHGLLQLFAQTEQFAFFDTSKPGEENPRSYLFRSPIKRLRCGIYDDPARFMAEVQRWLDKGCHVAGWFGYEFGAVLLDRVAGLTSEPGEGGRPVADLGVYGAPEVFDHLTGNHDFNVQESVFAHEYHVEGLRPNISEEEYLQALESVLEYIRAGDTYQVNYTLKLLFELIGSPEAMYRELRRNQSVSYGSYIRWGDERVMSFSPELFFRKHSQGLTVRPMKGTLKRGRNNQEDAQARNYLHNDQKNRSENVMIVDLLRNDLGRVLHEAGGGKVQVRSLFDVETYESLLQMTSTIDGKAEESGAVEVSLLALFQALFPCGSVTGAPKIRTMEIIHELEKEPRGVYTGAIGFFTPEGEAVFNVPIRTVVLDGASGEMGIGSGITHDSVPSEEWKECLLKGRFLTRPVPPFELIETMLWDQSNGFWLLDHHLARLCGSAEYFNFSCDVQAAVNLLNDHARSLAGTARVRLTLAKDGVMDVRSTACELPQYVALPEIPEPAHDGLPTIVVASASIPVNEPWCMHKTSQRSVYDEAYAEAQAQGAMDCILSNDRGEITEGAITNIFIFKDGRYMTPPVHCGLLSGTMRAHLIAGQGDVIEERVLTRKEVEQADAVFVCNSVRGVVQVRLAV